MLVVRRTRMLLCGSENVVVRGARMLLVVVRGGRIVLRQVAFWKEEINFVPLLVKLGSVTTRMELSRKKLGKTPG